MAAVLDPHDPANALKIAQAAVRNFHPLRRHLTPDAYEEALSRAALLFARCLKSYDPSRGVKLLSFYFTSYRLHERKPQRDKHSHVWRLKCGGFSYDGERDGDYRQVPQSRPLPMSEFEQADSAATAAGVAQSIYSELTPAQRKVVDAMREIGGVANMPEIGRRCGYHREYVRQLFLQIRAEHGDTYRQLAEAAGL